MKECKLRVTTYTDGENKNSFNVKSFKSKKEGIEYLKDFRNNIENIIHEDYEDELLDYWIERSNKYELFYEVRCTDYGTGCIDFRCEYKIV